MPSPDPDLAIQLFKDPYDFRFLPVTEESKEQAIEGAMVSHICKVLFELGSGFAFMGSQYKLTVGNEDYFVDMLFFNVRLHRFFIIELKANEFKPEYVGKLNFY